MRYLTTFLFVFALTVVPLVGCGGDGDQTAELLEEFLDDYLAERVEPDGPGVAVAVVGPAGVVFEKAYGMANLEESIPIGLDTPFDLASVSKQFTAMAVMILYEEGKLPTQDLISDVFPEALPEWSTITVHHLLTHQSGFPDYINDQGFWAPFGWVNEDVLAYLIDTPLEFAPGDRWEYSNSGYVMLALLVERVAEQPFEAFIHERIFDPLGMASSLLTEEDPPDLPNRALTYRADGEPHAYVLGTTGSGRIYSTIDDLKLWEAGLRDATLVSRDTLDLMFTRYVSSSLSATFSFDCSYGYGWEICDNDGWPAAQVHGGRGLGELTGIMRLPEEDVAFIMLSNGGFDWAWEMVWGSDGTLQDHLVAVYLGEEPPEDQEDQ